MPDLNTFPSSPRTRPVSSQPHSHSPPTSRRPSQLTGNSAFPGVPSSSNPFQDSTVPVRHPRPLTAAELHLELEKEQEAVVNRLTRELSALRSQQSASVVSTTSESSTTDNQQTTQSSDPAQPPSGQINSPYGPAYSTSARRDRSSSSLSSVSNRSVTSQGQPTAQSTSASAPVTGTSQASVDRARDAAGIGVGVNTGLRSRENSLASMVMPIPPRSRAPSASPHPSPQLLHGSLHGSFDPSVAYFPSQPHRQSVSSNSSAATRYEEAATAKAALEIARKENDMLVARVRELEGMLRGRRGAERRDRDSRSHAQEARANGASADGKDAQESSQAGT